MKLICITALAFLSMPALAQDNPENVQVTGSRIVSEAFGVVGAPSPLEPTKGCVEKDCGQPPEDPSGGGALTVAAKNAENKKAKEKAKKQKENLAENMKQDKPAWQKMLEWMQGVKIGSDLGVNFFFKVTTREGTRVEGGGCLRYKAELNKDNPNAAAGPCVERKLDAVPVVRANGTVENQLELSYAIYDTCYWEKTCRVEYITFIAGSPQELAGFINETIGEVVL
jgi:hypothetical protein